MRTHVFCYGSNMCTERILARAPSATLVATGYVRHRRLEFHKRGRDGSAKADAMYTGNGDDCIWGVVFSLEEDDRSVLDNHEVGYHAQQIVVVSESGRFRANVYVAHAAAIDATLRPFAA